MTRELATFRNTTRPADYRDTRVIQALWNYLLTLDACEEISMHLCPFAVPTFLAPSGTVPSLAAVDADIVPERRVSNWWEMSPPAPEPCLTVTLAPCPDDLHPVEQALNEATELRFKGAEAEELFMRGWEDKGLAVFPVDINFRPDPVRLAEAWTWLDEYLVSLDTMPDMPPSFADGKTWNFMDTEWRYIPMALPEGYRFERMVFLNKKAVVFFQPADASAFCPFCGDEVGFDAVSDRLRKLYQDEDFPTLDMITPCCSRSISINELAFEDHWFGIGKFSIRFSGWVRFTDAALEELGRVLGTRLTYVHTAR